MKTLQLGILAVAATFSLFSCQESNTQHEKTAPQDTVKNSYPQIELTAVSASPEFPGAALGIKSVTSVKSGSDSTRITFNFAVKNYELKMQTGDTATKMCNNSAKGQHIHFILDNKPYQALYEPTNDVILQNNTEHYLMAFLSRSYHESIKTKGAALVYHFKVDEKGNVKKLDDPKTPMLFYSRPKGDYLGKDTANVLLDYYVWNCTLAPDGYKVKAQISNDNMANHNKEIVLDKWEPHFIQNLGTGKCHVTLTLVDKDGKNVESQSATVTREFTLIEKEGGK